MEPSGQKQEKQLKHKESPDSLFGITDYELVILKGNEKRDTLLTVLFAEHVW